MKEGLKPEFSRKRVEAALKRIEQQLKKSPGSVFVVHSPISRHRGIKLLDALFATDEGARPRKFS